MRDLLHLQNTSTASVVHANSASVLPVVPSFTIPASEMLLGRRVRLRAWGVYSTHSTPPSINFALQQQGGNACTHPAYTLPASATNFRWEFEGEVITDTAAAGGTMLLGAKVFLQTAADGTGVMLMLPRAASVTHFGGAIPFAGVFNFGTANASNTLTVQSSEISTY